MTAKPKTTDTEIVNIDQQVSTSVMATPMSMLDRAVDAGASIEVLTKIMDLQERWEARGQVKAYNRSIAQAKAEMPDIVKNRQANFGSGKAAYKYEDLAQVTRTVDPILSRHGLHYHWRTSNPPGELITVTCIVSHDDGHSEDNSLSAAADQSGSKNSIQAIISTVTYLQRATLKAALGLAAGQDDDGNAGGKFGGTNTETATDEQVMEIYKLLGKAEKDRVALCKHLGIDALENMTISTYEQAKAAIAARNKRIADAKKEAKEAEARLKEAAKGKAGIEQPVTEDGEIL